METLKVFLDRALSCRCPCSSAYSGEQAQCCADTQWEYVVLATSIHKQEPESMNVRKQVLPEGLDLVRTSDSI